VAAAFPALRKENIKVVNTFAFKQHISGEVPVQNILAEAAGSKLMSGW